MSKQSEEAARRRLEADDQARQRQVSGRAWRPSQTIADPPPADDES